MHRAFVPVLGFVCLLWAIKAIESVAGIDLAGLGVRPRSAEGLPGIVLAPLVHGSWAHLVANTLPLLVLGTALLYGYPRSARIVLPAVYLGPELAVWLLARPSPHIGASGITYGLMFFVFTVGALRWDPRAIALSMIVFFLHGSMVWGVLPYDPAVSFETHLAGAVVGVALAFALRWRDPPPPRRRYSWEDEDGESGPDAEADPRSSFTSREHTRGRFTRVRVRTSLRAVCSAGEAARSVAAGEHCTAGNGDRSRASPLGRKETCPHYPSS